MPTSESFDNQASEFLAFSEGSFSWQFIERPAFDRYLPDFYNESTRVLDVGCGGGRLMKHLISKGVSPENIIGIDPSQPMLVHAQKDLPESGFERGSAEDLPFPDESFDLLVSHMVFHQMDAQTLARATDNMYRVLKKGGSLCFIDTNPIGPIEWRNKSNQYVMQETPWGVEVPVFVHSLHRLLENFKKTGFQIFEGGSLPVLAEGQLADPAEYARYSSGSSRIGYRMNKLRDGNAPEQDIWRLT